MTKPHPNPKPNQQPPTTIPTSANRYVQALITHYTAPWEQTFKQFRLGVITFGLGLALIFIAHNQLPPSLKQELIVLLGLIIVGLGFFIAMLAQVRLLISRILAFIWKDTE